jgi:spermidine synthase
MQHLFLKKSFTIQIGDLLFYVEPNKLKVGRVIEGQTYYLTTEIRKEHLDLLSLFSEESKKVIAPLEDYEVVFQSNEGFQDVFLLKDSNDDHALIINNQVQFTTNCERTYHEALVSPAIGAIKNSPKNILILGGGDGLAAKQIFKEAPDCNITLVDFDKSITDLFTQEPLLNELNEDSLSKCTVINEDAFRYVTDRDMGLEKLERKYDIIICDFPDPDQEIFNKLYSVEFYRALKTLLEKDGAISVQSGPLAYNSKCFLCIKKTLESAGINTLSYYTASPLGPSVFVVGQVERTPKVILKNKYETLNQEFFDYSMCTPIPNFNKKYENIQVNTLDNYAAYTYKMVELKLLKEQE